MRTLLIAAALMTMGTHAYAVNKIQKQGVKTLAECTAGGATAANCLIDTSQLYDLANAQQLSASITNGQLGGGGGSGINGIQNSNPNFESNLTGWTASGGSFTRVTSGANLAFGSGSAVFNASASSQTVTSSSVSMASGSFQGLAGTNGFASCFFKTTASDYQIQATDGTNVLAERTIPAMTSFQQIGVAFPFPSSGSVFLRIRSQSDAADLAVDNCFLGSTNVFNLSQAENIGTLSIGIGGACFWPRATASYADYSAATCGSYTATGGVSAPGTTVPHALVNNAKPGRYCVHATFSIQRDAAIYGQRHRLFESTTGTQIAEVLDLGQTSGGGYGIASLAGCMENPTAQNLVFKLQGQGNGASNAVVRNIETPTSFSINRFPTTQEQAFRPDQVNFGIEAQITGTGNIALGTPAVSQWAVINDANLTLANRSGESVAQIACVSGEDSSGNTCSGNENIGITFTPPYAGDFEACVQFHLQSGTTAANFPGFTIVRTSPTAVTVLDQIVKRTYSGVSGSSDQPITLCGALTLPASKVALRLGYAQGLQTTESQIRINQSLPAQPNVVWTVRPVRQQMPAPLLVGSVTSNSAGLTRVEHAKLINNGTTCTISSQSGSWLSSCVRNGLGDITATIAASIFSVAPICVPVAATGSGFQSIRTGTITSTSVQIQTTGADANIDLICMGPR